MSHGGRRAGAGRNQGSTKYGESTRPVRIPNSRVEEVKAYLLGDTPRSLLPLFSSTVRAGLPTSADDYIEDYIDLNSLLSTRQGNTFLVRAAGDSMINTPIFDGDILVVERTANAPSGTIVIAALGGELTVKRLFIGEEEIKLLAENPAYAPIIVKDPTDFNILGAVTHVIHQT